eukprot:GHUV01021928.1.p1 GENE.GHUV01021928.1~~GHUV01021928.1.p1  ORF type:complete len:120 (+),score=23.35 GHUV01021928.1:355-714(+)
MHLPPLEPLCLAVKHPSALLPILHSYDQLREMTRGKTVVVLPAFETAPQHNMTLAHDLADTAAMMTKEQLGKLVQRRLIYQFALYLFRQVGAVVCKVQMQMEQQACIQARKQAGQQQTR